MRNNGSPEALFETDDERNYFLTTLLIHPYLSPQTLKEFNQLSLLSTQSELQSTQSKLQSAQSETESTQSKPQSTQSETESAQFTELKWPEFIKERLKLVGHKMQTEALRKLILDLCRIHPLSAQNFLKF